jgi:thiamine-monophosphate kinase
MKHIRDIGELKLIERLTKGLRLDKSVVVGPGDDAAVIRRPGGKYLLYTCDMAVEDVHFKRAGATPFGIGWKALARNVSDIAAMGGVPRYATVSAALPGSLGVRYADGIYKGLKGAADRFGVSIVGGDLSRSAKITIDVSMVGEVERSCLVTRSGARPGDLIFVTGTIGASGLGRHLKFMPRLEEARHLVSRYRVSSMIDVSDGLLLDLWRVAEASRVGSRLYQNAVPVSARASSFDEAVREGEDFELLFTMSTAQAVRFMKRGIAGMKTPATLIGEVTAGRPGGIEIVRPDGRAERVRAGGYTHFL